MAKIYIVDDSRIFRKILKTTLSENGHEIIGEAGNGQEALDQLKNISPDVITLDITMPIMDGLQTLVEIKNTYPNIKVVMVSAAGQKAKVMEAIKNGAVDFLQKPFQPDEVASVITRILAK